MPKVGDVLRVWLPGGTERRCKVLAFDPHDEMVKVKWVDYAMSDEWIPTRWFD